MGRRAAVEHARALFRTPRQLSARPSVACLASPANSSLVISSAAARSNQCRVEMKLRDDARGLHAQGEAHELPHGKRLLGMRRLTPVGIPFLQASHISTDDRVFGRGEDVLVRFGTS